MTGMGVVVGVDVAVGKGVTVAVGMADAVGVSVGSRTGDVQDVKVKTNRISTRMGGVVMFRMGCILPLVA
jgi:hypothetical protein